MTWLPSATASAAPETRTSDVAMFTKDLPGKRTSAGARGGAARHEPPITAKR